MLYEVITGSDFNFSSADVEDIGSLVSIPPSDVITSYSIHYTKLYEKLKKITNFAPLYKRNNYFNKNKRS